MPTKPPTHRPGTGAPQHNPARDKSEARTIRSRNQWKGMSTWLRAKFPLCQGPWVCRNASILMVGLMPAESVHHIESIAKAPHLAHDPENTVPLCNNCHRRVEDMERCGFDTTVLFDYWPERVMKAMGGDAQDKQEGV